MKNAQNGEKRFILNKSQATNKEDVVLFIKKNKSIRQEICVKTHDHLSRKIPDKKNLF